MDDQENKCSICLEKLSDKAKIELECKHVFHTTCGLEWLDHNRNCPICRGEVPGGKKEVENIPQFSSNYYSSYPRPDDLSSFPSDYNLSFPRRLDITSLPMRINCHNYNTLPDYSTLPRGASKIRISLTLAIFMNVDPQVKYYRTAIIEYIKDYILRKQLFDIDQIKPDEKLATIFGPDPFKQRSMHPLLLAHLGLWQ